MNPTINDPTYKLLWAAMKTFVYNARVRYAKRSLDRAFRRVDKMTDKDFNYSFHSFEIGGTTYVRITDKEIIDIFDRKIEEAERIMKQDATNG